MNIYTAAGASILVFMIIFIVMCAGSEAETKEDASAILLGSAIFAALSAIAFFLIIYGLTL